MTASDLPPRLRAALAATAGCLGRPQAVVAPNGAPAGWVVPTEQGGRVIGFAQADPSGRVLRVVTAGASAALDATRARRVLDALLPDGAWVGVPRLSYDAHPTRLVWAFVVRDAAGERVWHVAGDEAWKADLRAEPLPG